MKRMTVECLPQQFQPVVWQHLPLKHYLKEVVHHGKERRDFFIREGVILAKFIVDVVEVKHYLLHLCVLSTPIGLHEREYVRQYLSLLFVRLCFSQVLSRIFIQLRGVEEERGFKKRLFAGTSLCILVPFA